MKTIYLRAKTKRNGKSPYAKLTLNKNNVIQCVEFGSNWDYLCRKKLTIKAPDGAGIDGKRYYTLNDLTEQNYYSIVTQESNPEYFL